MAGQDTKGHPAGTRTGDVLHVFQSGSIQMITDTSIDAAGDVWAANNWNYPQAAVKRPRPRHVNLGRRVRHHRHLWSRSPREATAHGSGEGLLTGLLIDVSAPRRQVRPHGE